MKTLDKVMRIGKLDKEGNIYCHAVITDGKLSLTGVIGPLRNGDARGSCGQIEMGFKHRNPLHDDKRYSQPTTPEEIEFAPGWTADKWLDLLEVWHRWHMNDSRPNCEHQTGTKWRTDKELELIHLTWGDAYHDLRRQIETGEQTDVSMDEWNKITKDVHSVTIGLNTPKHPAKWGELGNSLLARGMVKVEKTEHKTAGWTDHREHPEGLLCKPCPQCGYRYGTEWKREELPATVVEFLNSLPSTDRTPAWI